MDGSFAVILFIATILIVLCLVSINYNNNNNNNNLVFPRVTTSDEDMLNAVNEFRSKGATCGNTYMPPVNPLVWNDNLASAAQAHSDDMAKNNYFSHVSQNGDTFIDRIEDSGYTQYRTAGENLAAGYSTAIDAVEGLMESPGHCMNIMNGSFKEMGSGFASNPNSTYRYYWTQNFGSR